MKKIFFISFLFSGLFLASAQGYGQQLKVGVFDLDLMVQAMPAYRQVDSLVQIYEKDSLSEEYQYYMNEYERLDSTYKADSALVAQGTKSKVQLDMTNSERQKNAMNILYWQQISQNKSNNKRGELAQPLYNQVAEAYKKVLAKRKYSLILRPNTYEMGFPIDNLFISVAKELKLTQLPQELLYLGDDPDAVAKQPAAKPPASNAKKQ